MTSDSTLLSIFDALPDLLEMARAESAADDYDIQRRLRERYRAEGRAYLWTMPIRNLYFCSRCGAKHGEVLYEVGAPSLTATTVRLHESELHRIRNHNDPFPSRMRALLERLAGDSSGPSVR